MAGVTNASALQRLNSGSHYHKLTREIAAAFLANWNHGQLNAGKAFGQPGLHFYVHTASAGTDNIIASIEANGWNGKAAIHRHVDSTKLTSQLWNQIKEELRSVGFTIVKEDPFGFNTNVGIIIRV